MCIRDRLWADGLWQALLTAEAARIAQAMAVIQGKHILGEA
jgi:hypothetical protein